MCGTRSLRSSDPPRLPAPESRFTSIGVRYRSSVLGQHSVPSSESIAFDPAHGYPARVKTPFLLARVGEPRLLYTQFSRVSEKLLRRRQFTSGPPVYPREVPAIPERRHAGRPFGSRRCAENSEFQMRNRGETPSGRQLARRPSVGQSRGSPDCIFPGRSSVRFAAARTGHRRNSRVGPAHPGRSAILAEINSELGI